MQALTGICDYADFHASLRPGRLAMVDLATDRRRTYADLNRNVGA